MITAKAPLGTDTSAHQEPATRLRSDVDGNYQYVHPAGRLEERAIEGEKDRS